MKQLVVLELFAGTRSIGKAFEEKRHKVISVEWNKDFEDIDEYCDIGTLSAEYLTNKYGHFDVVWASPDCFPKGTLIWTDKGYKNVEEVKCFDKVLTHKGRYRNVYSTQKTNKYDMYKVKISGCEEILVSSEHPYYVRKKKRINTHKNGESLVYTELLSPEWLKVKNLNNEYKVGIPINTESKIPKWNGCVYEKHNSYGITNSHVENNLSKYLDKSDFWWLIGRYMGDGSLSKDKYTIDISCDKDKTNEIKPFLDRLNIKYAFYEKYTANHFNIFNKELVVFLEQFGVGALNKTITPMILNLPINLLKSFLDGYISADGCWDYSLKNPTCSLTTVSRELAYGLQLCLLKAYKRYASMVVNDNPNDTICGRKVNVHKSYNIGFYRDYNTKRMQYIIEDNIAWVNVKKVEKLKSQQTTVYNFSVENDESYTANNIIVHNCTSYSIAAISHHRRKNEMTGNLDPVSDYAKFCDEVDQHMLKLIKDLNPTYYFIENPRGGMRKMTWMQDLPRYTITYCKYEIDKPVEERRMKPTDIWTNHPNPKFISMCKNGDPCHARAPRGSRTGTQGLKGSKERSVIPQALCKHIVEISEEEY